MHHVLVLFLLILFSTDYAAQAQEMNHIQKGHEEAQEKTINIIRKLGKSVDKLIKKDGSLPSDLTDIETLVSALKDKKLLSPSHPTLDGWSNPLIFVATGADSYLIKSLGSDNKEVPVLLETIPEGYYHLDIVWSSGQFIQAPAKYLEEGQKKKPKKLQQKSNPSK